MGSGYWGLGIGEAGGCDTKFFLRNDYRTPPRRRREIGKLGNREPGVGAEGRVDTDLFPGNDYRPFPGREWVLGIGEWRMEDGDWILDIGDWGVGSGVGVVRLCVPLAGFLLYDRIDVLLLLYHKTPDHVTSILANFACSRSGRPGHARFLDRVWGKWLYNPTGNSRQFALWTEHTFYSIIPHKVRVVNKFMVELVEIREILMFGGHCSCFLSPSFLTLVLCPDRGHNRQ